MRFAADGSNTRTSSSVRNREGLDMSATLRNSAHLVEIGMADIPPNSTETRQTDETVAIGT